MRLNPFVAASVALGFAALSAFRPWWVPKKHQQTARLVYAGATGVLSAASSPDKKHTPVITYPRGCPRAASASLHSSPPHLMIRL